MTRRSTRLLSVLVLALGVALPAAADDFLINRVEVDDAAGLITIKGLNFGTDVPLVTLEGIPLNVVSNNNNQIANGPFGGRSSASFNATVGEMGPVGPQGPAGPAGPQGVQGPQGAQGP